MITISKDIFQQDVQAYLERVEAGETVRIESGGKPVAEMKPVAPRATPGRRPVGLCRGEFRVPDDFDAPLPEEVLQSFEGK